MTTNRRAFLFGASALLAAPAIVRASSLMKLWVPPKPKLIFDETWSTYTPTFTGFGTVCDVEVNGVKVVYKRVADTLCIVGTFQGQQTRLEVPLKSEWALKTMGLA